MFFPKLRRRAKWVFLGLALAFALGFLAFGVGTGVQGASIGDVLRDFLGSQGTSGPSVAEAREKLAQNPNDAEAQRELAAALESEGRRPEAIAAFERYVEMRPRDDEALRRLATLYDIQAAEARQMLQAAQLEAQEHLFAQSFALAGESPLLQALSREPIAQALALEASDRANEAGLAMQRAYRKEASVYQKLTLLLPDDPTVILQLGQAAQFGGDFESAIAAYERFLELAPDDPNAPIVRQQLEQLQGTGGSG